MTWLRVGLSFDECPHVLKRSNQCGRISLAFRPISYPAAHGESLFDAIGMVLAAGFRGFESVPADYQGTTGYPYTTKNVGLWPRTFGMEARAKLRDRLSDFAFVTVHSPNLGVNIACINPGVREESIRQYMEIMDWL